ncbi:winged helix-turn-helix domain-containing protein [Nonomuraea sp. C10]|uniref:winged helix-turn-helix domain-containing protein n=1 Tax=Nonomuraea sp. C10 TaxID=2600577 RepID=UPI0011CE3433|nr:winged helix-turn-helix domain-containing protein [Nonomuraea sp. C10]TXK42854.1 winged helix-turn-helix transcriptional regulator [Nonomuraea sp. C10]
MDIDPDGIRAPYLQLADTLRARIETGEFPPGRKVPSQTQLEEESGLSRNTVKKALDVLKSEGLLITAPGRGLFVTGPDNTSPT